MWDLNKVENLIKILREEKTISDIEDVLWVFDKIHESDSPEREYFERLVKT